METGQFKIILCRGLMRPPLSSRSPRRLTMRIPTRFCAILIAVLSIITTYFAFQTAQAQTGHMTQFPGMAGWYLGEVANGAVQATRLQAMGERVTTQRTEGQTSSLNLSNDAEAMPTEYAAGTGVKELTGSTRAHALASADFDEDGTPDLVGGYASDAGGVITLQRGNVDAIYPNSPEARERRANGQFSDAPFHAEASAFRLPEEAHFVGAGDFDADGHWDVVAARRGGRALYFLRGDGRGNLVAAERIELPGELTAFVTGEMNRPDGLTDVVVGLNGDAGAGVLVFESPAGALRGQPETLSLNATASGLALGALDADSSANDLAMAAGNELLVMHGRDRRLSLDAESRANVPAARVSRSAFEFSLAGVAIGDFAGDERADLAVLSTGGAVQVLTRAGGDKSEQAKTNKAKAEATQEAKQSGNEAEGAVEWERSQQTSVSVASDAPENSQTATLLMTVKVSSLAKDDLLVMGGGRAHIVTNEAAKVKAGEKAKRGEAQSFEVESFEPAADLQVSASLGAESELAAALPMRLSPSALSSLVVLGASSKTPSVVSAQAAVTFTVNSAANTDDTNRGNGECRDANGSCTLLAVVQEINASTNTGPYTINFNIPGAGVPAIQANGNFFHINKPVTIDGTTQPAGRVEITDTSSGHYGFFGIMAGNSTVRGLVLSGSRESIILPSSNNIVEGCYIGTNTDATADSARETYVGIKVNGSNNRIGGTTPAARNVISGNADHGIQIGAGSGNLVQGNYIGTNAAGAAALGNHATGILTFATDTTIGGATPGAGNLISGNKGAGGNAAVTFSGGASTSSGLVQGNLFGTDASGNAQIGNTGDALYVVTRVGVTTIGGTTPAARNIIAGSTGRGIYVEPFNSTVLVQGNYIGTNADGTTAMPNLSHGIVLGRAGVVVGGTAAGAGNLISGNGGDGINILSPSHTIQGNLIGTDVSGTLALSNIGDGIETFRADGTLIGGTTPVARNVISGNRENGVRFGVVDNPQNPIRVEGNYIGVNRFGTGALGNGWHGVYTRNVAGHYVGGTAAGAGNVIAHNSDSGIASETDFIGGAVLSNSIHSNAHLGIDIGDNGVSPDAAVTATARRPALTSVTNTDAGTVITGTVPNHNSFTPYTIQFFSNPACDPSGHGEGQTFIGQMTFTPSTQNVPANFSHTISPATPGGTFITAVSVRQADGQPAGVLYTSEFSNCAQLAAPTPPPPPPVPLQLFVIAPARGGDAAAVTRQITGRGFLPGATARLTRAGQPDIVGTGASVTNEGTTLTATFDLTGRERGLWSVIVTNPDSATATLTDAFTIGEARPSQVWVDVIGRFTMRSGLEQTFYIAYGNNGDVDAAPSLIQIIIPPGLSVAQPPLLPNGNEPSFIHQEDGGMIMQFFVAKIPPGSAVYHQMRLKTKPDLAHLDVELEASIYSSESFQAEIDVKVDPTVTLTPTIIDNTANHAQVNVRVASATVTADYSFEFTISEGDSTGVINEPQVTIIETETEIEYIVTVNVPRTSSGTGSANIRGEVPDRDEVPTTRNQPQNKWVGRGKVLKPGYDAYNSYKKLLEAKQEAILEKRLTDCLKKGVIPELDVENAKRFIDGKIFVDQLSLAFDLANVATGNELSALGDVKKLASIMDYAWYKNVTSTIYSDMRDSSFASARYPATVQQYVSEHKGFFGPSSKAQLRIFIWILHHCKCSIPKLPSSIQTMEKQLSLTNDAGQQHSDDLSCEACSNDTCDTSKKIVPLKIVFSSDPNDKVGAQGAGAQHFIAGFEPMRYSIFFENKPEATAPAQDVVITDQLDVSKFDLSTFSLGPVSFGKDRIVTPPPGLSEWTTDVDLRPANKLVVRISAKLDKATGLVTWKFISLDPATMQPTQDALAGFLPPNKTAPEGEGSVLFTVAPKASLQTGDEIRNKARIVFDANAPIDTPHWLNTIDLSKPASQVTQAAFDGCKKLTVNWSGTDTGSGIAGYDVYVSENGGPLSIWQQNATAASGIFTGQQGKTYTFFSVARDIAGNIEDLPSIADATATVNDTTKPQITAPAAVSALIGAGDTSNALVIPDSTLGQAVASDSCSQVTVTRTGVPAGNSFTVGTHTITYTATDATGNTATATQTVTVTVNNVLPVIQLNSATHSVSEDALRIAITINRNGDLSLPATINYATNDQAGLTPCNVFNGMASSRCDYATTVGTLRFAAGEGTKVIFIPAVDDTYAEGTESLTLTLSNPSAASLGATTATTITITDNEAVTGANPIEQAPFFVRQHYMDFLGREPEPAGLQGWLNVLNNCGTTVQQPCDRIEVSSGFFRSEEFQTRGYFIYRFYSAVGKVPLYEEFMPDLAKVSGFLSAQQLEENKAAFVSEFMARSDFQTKYGSITDPTNYVDALLQTIGLMNHPGRGAWIEGLSKQTMTRAQVLRAVVESTEVFQKYYTEAFVIMQYFGYLRRSADISYLQWIQTMNQTGGDYRTMINGFLNSPEYRMRFGP
jgi:hypothetical protein